jgi:hypothetical protein
MDIDLLTLEILEESEILPSTIVSGIIYEDLVKAILMSGSIKGAASLLDISDSALEHILARKVLLVLPKPDKLKWDNYLLSTIYLKKCANCKIIKDISMYGLDKSRYYGISQSCYDCDALKGRKYLSLNRDTCINRSREHYLSNKNSYLARNANRRALRLKATPNWANLAKIKEIYANCPENHHVDHIIPLKGELVSGLHVENNLQYLTAKENMQKSNKFKPE